MGYPPRGLMIKLLNNKQYLKSVAIGDIVSRFFFATVEIFLARYLDLGTYGRWSLIQIFLSINNFLQVGLISAVSRKSPQYIFSKKKIYRIIQLVVMALPIIWIIYSIFLGLVFYFGFLPEALSEVIFIFIPLVLLQVFYQLFTVYRQSSLSFDRVALSKILLSIVFFICVLLIFFLNNELNTTHLVFSMLLAYLASSVLFFKDLKSSLFAQNRVTFRRLSKTYKYLLSVGFPLYFFGFSKFLTASLDKFFISYDMGYEELALYSIPFLFATVGHVIANIFVTIYSPILIIGITKNEENKNILTIVKDNLLSPSVVLITSLALILLSFYTVINIFLLKYSGTMYVAIVLVLTVFPVFISQISTTVLSSLHLQNKILKITIIGLFLVIASNLYVFYFKLGIFGYASALLLANILIATMFLISLRAHVKSGLAFDQKRQC
jgi:O-antigen/teichoic acid export membrane protein